MIKLIDMPFSFCDTASLSLATFKSQIQDMGMDCEYIPLNIRYGAQVGFQTYFKLTGSLSVHHANWVFSEHICLKSPYEYLKSISHELPVPTNTLYELRFQATKFLEQVSNEEHWGDSSIIGFSTYLHQVSAVLSLSKLLKQKHPDIPIVVGGPNVLGNAGIELIEKCPWIDVVFSGQSDFTFPEFCLRTEEKKSLKESLRDLSGVIFRDKGELVIQPGHSHVDLNKLPLPDFDDFLDAFEPHKNDAHFKDWPPHVYFEFSRGCVYGVKKLCSFCSYVDSTNGVAKFRTTENALQLLKDLKSRYFPRVNIFALSDPLLPKQMISTVFESWGQERENMGLKENEMLFWAESKPWLSRDEFRILKKAGMDTMHLGIEHLHPEAIKGMKKGQTSIACLANIKWSIVLGIKCEWHYMLEIPGQKDNWHTDVWGIVPKLIHLPAPIISTIQLTQNQPYYFERESYGIQAYADKEYQFVLPPNVDPEKAAYFFSYDTISTYNQDVTNETERILGVWQADSKEKKSSLILDGSSVIDTRNGDEKIIDLTKNQIRILHFCDAPQTKRKVLEHCEDEDLLFLLNHDLVIFLDERYLSLVVIYELNPITEMPSRMAPSYALPVLY